VRDARGNVTHVMRQTGANEQRAVKK